tara:strand:+ start:36 stop:422 length:387 start_codon:yes stop_codon:yes gene_type:complete
VSDWMNILDKVLIGSTFVGALGAFIGGTVVLAKNTGELNQLFKKFKTSLTTNSKSENHSTIPRKAGICRICSKKGYTEWHHIISRGHSKKTGQEDLITNPGNVVELCKSCHNQTTASKSWYMLRGKNR